MVTQERLVWIVAAALASTCALDDAPQGKTGLSADFAPAADKTREGFLRTSKDYGIRIDRLTLDASKASLRGRSLELDEGPETLEALAGERLELSGVYVEARVFDLRKSAKRLPDDGIGVSGSMPLEVMVRREVLDDSQSLATHIDFDLPYEFIDGIEWSLVSG